MELLIGCPTWKREWVLGLWFDHIEAASRAVDIEPAYIVVLDTRDVASEAILRASALRLGRDMHILHVSEDGNRSDIRDWGPQERYHHMVWLRNTLLHGVRLLEPDQFLSLDSDILLAAGALPGLLETSRGYDAVGGKVFLSVTGTECPSYSMVVNANSLQRPDTDSVIDVDCIMAMKLMNPSAYAVDYAFHWGGEDFGWSKACKDKGLTLAFDGRVTSKHVMVPEMLDFVDKRCGY